MDVPVPPVPASVLSELGELRREQLQGELKELTEKRAGLNGELEALDKDTVFKQRALELVEESEGQLTGRGRGQPDLSQGRWREGEHAGEGLSQEAAGHQGARTAHTG
jgi:hypothetical protein